MRPLLSLCIPQWGKIEWLEFCLDSLFRQWDRSIGRKIEVVLSDDGIRVTPPVGGISGEEMAKRMAHYRREGFRYLLREECESPGHLENMKRAVEASRGEFVWVLGNDDYLLPGSLERIVSLLESNEDLDYFFVNYYFWAPEKLSLPPPPLETILARSHRQDVGPTRRIARLEEICLRDPNYFSPCYCNLMRRIHWKRSLAPVPCPDPLFRRASTSALFAVYIIDHLLFKPAFVVAEPVLAASHDVTWLVLPGAENWDRILEDLKHRIERRRFWQGLLRLEPDSWRATKNHLCGWIPA